MGNRLRDALKVGELSVERDVTTPSQSRAKSARRCRDWTGAAYVKQFIRSRHSPDHERKNGLR
jgi:hypothetical protein